MENRVPARVRTTQACWPLQLKIAGERGLNFQRMLGLDLEEHNGSGIVHGHKPGFVYRKCVACVQNADRLRACCYCPHQRFSRNTVPFSQKAHVEIAQDFQWIYPSFEISSLIA